MSQPRTLPKPVNHRQDYKQKDQISKEYEQAGISEKPIPRFKLIFVFYENILIHSLLAGSCIFFNSKVASFLSDGATSKLASHLLYLFGYIQVPFVILNMPKSRPAWQKEHEDQSAPIYSSLCSSCWWTGTHYPWEWWQHELHNLVCNLWMADFEKFYWILFLNASTKDKNKTFRSLQTPDIKWLFQLKSNFRKATANCWPKNWKLILLGPFSHWN